MQENSNEFEPCPVCGEPLERFDSEKLMNVLGRHINLNIPKFHCKACNKTFHHLTIKYKRYI